MFLVAGFRRLALLNVQPAFRGELGDVNRFGWQRMCVTNGCTTNGGGESSGLVVWFPPSRDPYRSPDRMKLDIIFPAIGVVLLSLGVLHEWRWRCRIRTSVVCTGRVVDIHDDADDGYFPEIEYTLGGDTKRFRSAYSIPPTPFIGADVQILVDTTRGDAEVNSSRTRLGFTIVPLAGGLFFLVLGLATMR